MIHNTDDTPIDSASSSVSELPHCGQIGQNGQNRSIVVKETFEVL